jgi:cold shock CspA family protein
VQLWHKVKGYQQLFVQRRPKSGAFVQRGPSQRGREATGGGAQIVWRNNAYGRILRADNGRTIFFHRAQQIGTRHLREGDRVSFIEATNGPWGEYADDVKAEYS